MKKLIIIITVLAGLCACSADDLSERQQPESLLFNNDDPATRTWTSGDSISGNSNGDSLALTFTADTAWTDTLEYTY